jgi:hypothetical protein
MTTTLCSQRSKYAVVVDRVVTQSSFKPSDS